MLKNLSWTVLRQTEFKTLNRVSAKTGHCDMLCVQANFPGQNKRAPQSETGFGQSDQSFLAALKMKGRQCNLKIKCSKSGCGEMVDYSEEVIRNLFIMGLSDVELQQDIMVVDDMTLKTAVKQDGCDQGDS